MDGMASGIERDGLGRFVAGQSGNPAGKLPGTRNRKTLLMEALREGEGEAVARVVIDKALSGDAVAARFCLGMISPRPRGRTIHLDLPEDDSCNVVAAFNATLRALADGEITPDEAVKVARFLDGRRRVLQAWQLEEKLTSYGRTIPGDPPSLSNEAEEIDEDEEPEDEDPDDENEYEDDLTPHLSASASGPAPKDSCASPLPEQDPAPTAAEASAPIEALEPRDPAVPGERLVAQPGNDGEAALAPTIADDPSAAAVAPECAPLQSACISRSSGTIRGMISIPSDADRRALAALVARRRSVLQ
jgi:hypothetical protein